MASPKLPSGQRPAKAGQVTAAMLLGADTVVFGRIIAATKAGVISRWQPFGSPIRFTRNQTAKFWLITVPIKELQLEACWLHEQPTLRDYDDARRWAMRFRRYDE